MSADTCPFCGEFHPSDHILDELADLRLIRDKAQQFGMLEFVEVLDRRIEDVARKIAEVGL